MKVVILELPEEAEGKLADIIAAALALEVKKSAKGARISPFSVKEASALLGVSEVVIYDRVKTGQIHRVPEISKILIPAYEMRRLLGMLDDEDFPEPPRHVVDTGKQE